MKKLIYFIAFIIWAEPMLAQEISIQVLDRATQQPVVQAHVKDHSEKVLTVTDADGYFTIDPEQNPHVFISAVGFSTIEIHLNSDTKIVYLNPQVFRDKTELIVVANPEGQENVHAYHQRSSTQNMDQFLDNIDGISTNKRGAFAWEPVIRGQSDQRMNLTIDGMQVFKACVDKMDPITSYVETKNLSKLDIDKSGSGVAQNGSGRSSVDLITQQAESTPFSMEVNSAYRYPDHFRTFNLTGNTSDASGRNAVRFSGSYKKAEDFTAGNDRIINNTQYEKFNLNVSYKHTFASEHSIEANYITDKAYDVGYPALLMDATKALADIGQIRFNFAPSDGNLQFQKIQLYANTIRHWMDDEDRDVANREVMRGMHMPMYGTTTTFGTRVNGRANLFDHSFDWFLNGFSSNAFGDMEMISIYSGIEDMYIYNLDDVQTRNLGLGLKHQFQLSKSVLMKVEESLNYKSLGTGSDRYASFFEGAYGREVETQQKFLLSGSLSTLWMVNDRWSLSGNLVYSERMGNHMELFGHYVYNYTDGFFYDGNPWLDTERSFNTDINVTFETVKHSFTFSLFHKQYFNYIDGVLAEDVSSIDFQFKRYANVGNATISGGELRMLNNFSHVFSLENRVSYLYAQNQTLGEPLPLISPLKGNSMLHIHHKKNMWMGEVEWAAAQNRIAETMSTEDRTNAYAILNATWERNWLNGSLTSILSINNLLDNYYHTHTSIGNIPEAGRNVMVSVSYNF
ncbi:TonB-dependent receptor domain-containing protein [Gracilimonas tropica]|uniref:TonB-dependent receptor domain-containing protein n=1 Tax=Gracilimonas tropica TaxID=454600 RepID=UPI00036DCE15|nr:TonB-dependent receptor [Gracilimonas tropica]